MRRRMMMASAGNRGGIPNDGLVTHYTMDNISGATLIDETENYNGAIVGATPGAGFLYFDGINDLVDNSYPSKVQAFSWFIDVTPDTIADKDNLIDHVGGYGATMLRFRSNNTLDFYVYNGAFTILQSPVSAGQNYRIVAMHDGITTQLWVNGVLKDSRSNFGSIVYQGPESGRRLGNRRDSVIAEYYDGKMFEFAEYNRLLTTSEIAEHFS